MASFERLGKAVIPVAAVLGTVSCGAETYENVSTAEVIRQRDKGECPEGKLVRFGGLLKDGVSVERVIATHLGRDPNESAAEEFYGVRDGVSDQQFLVERPVSIHDSYTQFNGDQVIVEGKIRLGENLQGNEECLLYASKMVEVSRQ